MASLESHRRGCLLAIEKAAKCFGKSVECSPFVAQMRRAATLRELSAAHFEAMAACIPDAFSSRRGAEKTPKVSA